MNSDRPRLRWAAWRDLSATRQATWFGVGLFALVVFAVLATPPLMAAIVRAEQDVALDTRLLAIARQAIADDEALARAQTPTRTGDVRTAVEATLARHGVRSTASATPAADGQFSAIVAETSFDTLVRALDGLARDNAVHVVEARVNSLVQRGRVRAELTFGR